MMKLKYLFDNIDASLMLLENWAYDKDRPDRVTPFRTSANAVYVFYIKGRKHFLRFTPAEEKEAASVQAELDFLRYLREQGYPVVKPVACTNGQELVVADTPWGTYQAVVFEEVKGQPMDQLAYSAPLYHDFGKALGRLHALSTAYQPIHSRPDWDQMLSWCEEICTQYSSVPQAHDEIRVLRRHLTQLPKTVNNYGLIHYDFETDNVFYDPHSNTFTPIDFDDALYHWFALDVGVSVRGILKHVPSQHSEEAARQFLEGYRCEMELEEEMLAQAPVFKRYADLYGYARLLRATHEKWDNEPQWMEGLRAHLANDDSQAFGSKIIL